MNGATKALLGAVLTFLLCAILATPSGDPITMIVVGTAGAVIGFFLVWWSLTRRASASWTSSRQVVLSGAITACVTLTVYLLARISAS
jgi:peptidoglycan biosynthesis protein MviN/MurJ (putative lipid II flippase)